MRKTVLILVLILNFSCKEEKQKETNGAKENVTQEAEPKKEVKDNIFKLNFNVRILENDKFRVFYAGNSPDEKFSEKQMVVTSIKGNPDYQTVLVKLPVNIIPYKLRVDIGENNIKNESAIDFKSVNLELNGNSIIIDNDTLNSFFRPNEYLKRTATGFERNVVKDKYDPFLVSTSLLNTKIENEL